jgi:RNA polymerase sigma factor (sigma-70 family)
MAQLEMSAAPAPPPVRPGAGRGTPLPRDPGRATELLYRRHGATVFRFAWHLLGRREDAEDATQATFLAVHGALSAGTAVLEPRAWVLRIARNECMGRLRRTTGTPPPASLDGIEVAAPGGVERSAELRDEIRVARSTLDHLPRPEREAFVLREWLGLETGEVALALGLSAVAVDGLAGRARRSLVLAVGGLEPAAGCGATRSALELGSLDRAVRVHLLRCPVCRGVRRALRAPEETVGRLVPVGIIAERLADALPGFASGGGGIVAALTAKAAAAPLAAKTVAVVVAALVTAGVAKETVHVTTAPARSTVPATARGGEARELRSPIATVPQVAARVVSVVHVDEPVQVRSRRGGQGESSSRRGSSGGGPGPGRARGGAAHSTHEGGDGSEGGAGRSHASGRGDSAGGGDSGGSGDSSRGGGDSSGGKGPSRAGQASSDRGGSSPGGPGGGSSSGGDGGSDGGSGSSSGGGSDAGSGSGSGGGSESS